MTSFNKNIIALCAALAFIGVIKANAVADNDSITDAAAAILGEALKGSVENIEQLGVKLDRQALMVQLGQILNGKAPKYSYQQAYSIIDNHVAQIQRAYIDSVFSPESQQAFIDATAAEPAALKTPSGLVLQVLTEGEGVNPASGDDVVINYVGKLSDGSVFDQTEAPVTFDVDRLVPGFTEGLKLMKPGGRYRLVIPSRLAYGERGVPGDIPPNATLDFTIELLSIIPKPTN